MKTLILVRHAKSSWAEAGLSDFDRPLNDRGKKDAPEMAKRLRERGINIDLFLSSPAKRARKTAKLFAEEYGVKKDDIKFHDPLYLATEDAFLEAIRSIDENIKTAAIFSHNPGITELANALANVRIDDMPTCAIVALRADTDSWKNFPESKREFLFFDYPKAQ